MKRERLLAALFLLVCISITPPAYAQSDDDSETIQKYHLGFESQAYRTVMNPSWFPIMSLGGETFRHFNEYEIKADLDLRLSLRNPTKAFTLTSKNFYIGENDQSYESPLRFTYGRRELDWSALDERWALGAVQPMNAWDRLRPEQQGLTGIFAYTETQKLMFRFFFSYLALPETGPNVVLEDNHFVEVHPQSITSTPQTISLLNRPTPLGYNLQIPSLGKILLRPSFAFMVETKPEIPVSAKFMYGDLPLNYFPLALHASVSLPLDQVIVDVLPRLIEHHIYSGDLAYRLNDRVRFGVGLMIDQPLPENLPADYRYTPLSTSVMTSPWISYQLSNQLVNMKFMLTHLWINGGVETDVGPAYVDPNQSVFSSHLFYRSATQFSMQTVSTQAWSTLFKYIHEYSIQADWFALDFIYQTKSRWKFLLGGDVISAKESVSLSHGAEFLSDLRALDRIRVGAIYAF